MASRAIKKTNAEIAPGEADYDWALTNRLYDERKKHVAGLTSVSPAKKRTLFGRYDRERAEASGNL
jgi:hypothetical protein